MHDDALTVDKYHIWKKGSKESVFDKWGNKDL